MTKRVLQGGTEVAVWAVGRRESERKLQPTRGKRDSDAIGTRREYDRRVSCHSIMLALGMSASERGLAPALVFAGLMLTGSVPPAAGRTEEVGARLSLRRGSSLKTRRLRFETLGEG